MTFVYVQVDELKESLAVKKEELEKLQERETSLMTTLSNTIGDNNKFEAFLTKVFKKKIKRTKKKSTNEGECINKKNCGGEQKKNQFVGFLGNKKEKRSSPCTEITYRFYFPSKSAFS